MVFHKLNFSEMALLFDLYRFCVHRLYHHMNFGIWAVMDIPVLVWFVSSNTVIWFGPQNEFWSISSIVLPRLIVVEVKVCKSTDDS